MPYSIKWSIVEKVYGKTKIDCCPLRLAEKLHLAEYFYDIRLLNKRSEFINHCIHQNKLFLKSLKINDIWIETKYLYASVECLIHFAFDTDIFLFNF